ncbi:YesL family protein [Rossellomorea marisflavi]|uniref:YesL family protein n=1 Tax=Rossellomorea marisflavi TaxID=189381 RepID=UPI00064E3B4A|nr:YesL family protein [Rossellomorea marisflavi]KML08185.1 hypothetical protein VL06_01600 [Rossellomorea marisflavi]
MGGWERFNNLVWKVIHLAYLNLLWAVFTVAGLGILGFFPATAAVHTVARKRLMGDEEFPMFKVFWESFRSEFVRANGFMIVFALIGYILYYDILFIQMNSGKLTFLVPVLLFISLSFILAVLFFFPVYVHFRLRFFSVIKQALLIALTSPVEVVMMIAGWIAVYGAVSLLPGLIPLCSVSVLAYLGMWTGLRAFSKIEGKKAGSLAKGID